MPANYLAPYYREEYSHETKYKPDAYAIACMAWLHQWPAHRLGQCFENMPEDIAERIVKASDPLDIMDIMREVIQP